MPYSEAGIFSRQGIELGFSGIITAYGEPLGGVTVTVYNAATNTFVKGAITDSRGRYSIGALPTGTYKMRFQVSAPGLSQYYDHKGTMGAATLIPLGVGESATISTDLSGPLTY